MTHCLSFIAHLNQQEDFYHKEITPTVDGMRGVYVDRVDGQHYEVIVRPISPTTLTCRLCKAERPAAEIVEGAGDCAFCALQKVRT